MNDEHHHPLTPIARVDGYLPLEDHGLVGDGATAALVGRDGAVSWLCVPRFDADPLFCSLLDRERGGAFRLHPEGLEAAAQWYEPDTGVLHTVLRGADGVVQVTDALVLREGVDLHEDRPAGANTLLRSVRALAGRPRLVVDVDPRGGASARRHDGGLALERAADPAADLHLVASRPLEGLRSTVELGEGGRLDLALRWGADAPVGRARLDADELLRTTTAAWRAWLACFTYEGPAAAKVRRSALTLKLLDHTENGAIVAAPTSSLPEAIGGERNWDYRYSWVRDAAFSVYALHRIGLTSEAEGFLRWVLDIVDRGERPRVLYTIDGGEPPAEVVDDGLEGYRGSGPVRWGNAAARQRQHDVYGELLDCAYQWVRHEGVLPERLAERLRALVDAAADEWRTPDHGIWEVRTPGHVFTYSAALCHVALDRGARLAASHGLRGDAERWRRTADEIRDRILEEAWDPAVGSLTGRLGGDGRLDASVLSLPLRRVLPATHPRMAATTDAVRDRLGVGDGLLLRYDPDEMADGVGGHEGAFVLCSFWLVDNLAHQGRTDEAAELFESLCARTSPLGLLAEEIDPSTGAFLGNFPQAFSHVGLVSSAVNLARHHPGGRP